MFSLLVSVDRASGVHAVSEKGGMPSIYLYQRETIEEKPIVSNDTIDLTICTCVWNERKYIHLI